MDKFVSPRNSLLAQLSPEEFLMIKSHLTDFVAPAGVVIQEPGQAITHIYFLHSGMVSLRAVLKDGSNIECASIGQESLIGSTVALGAAVAVSRCVVQLPVVASRISPRNFLQAMSQSVSLRHLVHRSIESLMFQIQQIAACNASHHIEARLARKLLDSHDRSAGRPFSVTQEVLSEILAVRRTSVTEAASNLQDEGLIKYRRGHVEIIDRSGLEEKACECYGEIVKQTGKLLAARSALAGARA